MHACYAVGAGTALLNATTLCCLQRTSYAQLQGARSCVKFITPGSTTVDLCKVAKKEFGFRNQGPNTGKMLLARKGASCFQPAVRTVGDVGISCPLGEDGNRVRFKVSTPAPHRWAASWFVADQGAALCR
jgi:hypothetical protein